MANNSFYDKMVSLIGEDEAAALITALTNFPAKSVRYNSTIVNQFDLEEEEVAWAKPYGRIWSKNYPPSADLSYLTGNFYIQEKSAMLAVSLALANLELKDAVVLDMCASPGGKSTQMAESSGCALLVANEVIKSRVDALLWNCIRHRLSNVVVLSEESEVLSQNLAGYFDLVIVDAPCSGEGLFQKKKQDLSDWSDKNVQFCALRQQKILAQAAKTLKTGGYLVYSTCTFSPEENEQQVEFLLSSGFKAVELKSDFGVSHAISVNPGVLSCARRIFPHREGGAGAFAAILQKVDEVEPFWSSEMVDGKEELAVKHDLLVSELKPNHFFYEKNEIISALSYHSLPHFVYKRAKQIGALLFNNQKFLTPLYGFLAVSSCEPQIQISQDQAAKFAKGEDLRMEVANGWYFVAYNKLVLGFAKAANNRVVNKLPNPLISNAVFF